MECYFCLEFLYIFLHHIHMGFTCSKRWFISLCPSHITARDALAM